MLETIWGALLDSLIDGAKLLPFLFLTYLLMEFIEEKAEEKTEHIMKKSGRFGPALGGLLGIVPQCGFSAAAASLYAGRIITLGTLIAVFLSTSDEMIPILLSEAVNGSSWDIIWRAVLIKVVVGIVFGFVIDFVMNLRKKGDGHLHIHELCEAEDCHCEKGILHSTIVHTLKVWIFIFLITLMLNLVVAFIGEEQIKNLFISIPIVGELVAGLIGLIPNCASSVLLTELYLEGTITSGCMMSGLLVAAGVGILTLCRTNHHAKENLGIIVLLYISGVVGGILVGMTGILP
ncbi:MAG: arsenic efflux protein [Lachnospiraceae bacterium]|nr:arsenic efflux protein [Candidatus Merdinaster equi]